MRSTVVVLGVPIVRWVDTVVGASSRRTDTQLLRVSALRALRARIAAKEDLAGESVCLLIIGIGHARDAAVFL